MIKSTSVSCQSFTNQYETEYTIKLGGCGVGEGVSGVLKQKSNSRLKLSVFICGLCFIRN